MFLVRLDLPARLLIIVALVSLIGSSSESATFTVTRHSDSGEGSLRDAILSANASPNEEGVPDRIEFDIFPASEDPNDAPPALLDHHSLVSLYRAEGNANDSSGENDGALSNGASYASGLFGEAFLFNGIDQSVIVPDSPTLDVTAEFTLSAWLNPSSLPIETPSPFRDAAIISKIGGPNGNNGYQLGLNPDYTQAFIQFNAPGEGWPGNQHIVTLPNPIPIGRWSHLVGTYDGDSLHLYVNGNLVGSKFVGPKTVVNSASNLRISGDDNLQVYFPGRIDEAAVYSTALEATEIAVLFSAGVGSVRTIQPLSPLPVITDPVVIDGFTQLGSTENTNATGAINANLKIELDGSNAGVANGLVIASGESTIRGLTINRFMELGIRIQDGGGNTVEGCFIGTDVSGMSERPNGFSGIFILSADNLIGGPTPAARNLLSGNGFHGVEISGSSAIDNRVQGNLIGTDAAGTGSLPGVDTFGVLIDGGSNSLIGGTAVGEGNVISGNKSHGVVINQSSGNHIQGNFIGTDAAGTSALGNGARGMDIADSTDNLIGGREPGARNIISANTISGLRIREPASSGNRIQGNYIGTDLTGAFPLGNGNQGVVLANVSGNTVGGVEPGSGNLIAFNVGAGVSVSPLAVGQSILGNSIHSNQGLGIDLLDESGTGATPNDPDDSDAGGNNLQNFPVLTEVGLGNGKGLNLVAHGGLQSTPITSFRIEVFANAECDPALHGEGERLVGFTETTTDGEGTAGFMVALASPVSASEHLTAAATVIEGPESYGDTSEFSPCLSVNLQCSPSFPDYVVSGRVDPADLLTFLQGLAGQDENFDLTCDQSLTGVDLFAFSAYWYDTE